MLVAMTDRPVLFASYAGVLGGAERMLLDVTTRLDIPLTIACPEGALADAVRRAGLQHSALKPRPLRSRPHHLFGLAYELAKHRGTLVAWGARTVLAASMLPRPRFVAVHHDLYPRPAIRGAVRAATRRASITVATSRTIAAQLPNATVIHPGVDLAAYQPTPLPDGPPHAV